MTPVPSGSKTGVPSRAPRGASVRRLAAGLGTLIILASAPMPVTPGAAGDSGLPILSLSGARRSQMQAGEAFGLRSVCPTDETRTAARRTRPAGSPPSAAAQASPQAAQVRDAVRHDVAVTLKLIQVYVTDKKGKPIADLTLDDFRIYDNGREMTLSAFERHDLMAAAAPEAAAPDPADAPSVTRKFLLFFDFAFNTSKGVEKAMTAALHFLDETLVPGDEVGVASFSLVKGMKIHELFTADHALTRQAVVDLTSKSAAGRFENMEDMYWSQSMSKMLDSSASEGGAGGAAAEPAFRGTPSARENALAHAELTSQVQMYLNRLSDLARALRYVPGQKNLIVFSSGIPNSVFHGTGLGHANNLGDDHLRTRNEEMLRELATANVSFFTFDTREQAKAANLFGTDEQTFASGVGRPMGGSDSLNFYTDEKLTGRYTLEQYSRKTGGKYFGNIREFERNMEQVQDLTGTFYVLGYSVREEGDGEFHEVRVETDRPGATIHTQSGYYNPKPFTAYSKLEKEMHLFDLALSAKPMSQTPRPADVLGLSGPVPGGNMVVLSRLAPETVELLCSGPAEIVVFVFDEQDQVAGLVRMEHALISSRGKPFFTAAPLRLNPGSYSCRVVVRDLETGIAAVGAARVTIPAEQTGRARLHTPLVLIPRGPEVPGWLEGRTSAAGTWATVYPFDKSLFVPVTGSLPSGVLPVLVVLPCTIADDSEVGIRAILVKSATSDRWELPLVPVGHAQTGNTITQAYEIPVEQLGAGDYILYFHAESDGKALSHTWVRLTVR